MLKRGQGLSTNAIILIILGVVVLALLILGFTLGWNNISEWISPSDNVDDIVDQCQIACSTNSKYDFCTKARTLKEDNLEIGTNCATFSVISEYSKYGISACPTVDCDFSCEDIMIKDVEGNEKFASLKDSCDGTEDDITSITSVGGGQKCCIAK